jgi:hypothetical protein
METEPGDADLEETGDDDLDDDLGDLDEDGDDAVAEDDEYAGDDDEE